MTRPPLRSSRVSLTPRQHTWSADASPSMGGEPAALSVNGEKVTDVVGADIARESSHIAACSSRTY